MKKSMLATSLSILFSAGVLHAQDLKQKDVPVAVKTAFAKKYPHASKVSWEKEKGNFEANWGGKSGEDNAAMFTPAGVFLELVEAIPVSKLPGNIAPFVKQHYKGASIKEAGKVTDASGRRMFEAEIKGKDLIFDEKGNFIKED